MNQLSDIHQINSQNPILSQLKLIKSGLICSSLMVMVLGAINSVAYAAPLVGGFVQPMPNEFWPYNSTVRKTGTAEQQKSPFENPDVFCAQEDYRLPAMNEISTQFRAYLPWNNSGDTSLIRHWSAFPNNDITQQPLVATAANVRSVGGGVFNEWGNLGSYATATYESGNYVSGWNQTFYWVAEPTVQGAVLGRYMVNNASTLSWNAGTTKQGVACVIDLVPTPANS